MSRTAIPQDGSATPLLQLAQASKRYRRSGGTVQALEDFELHLQPGEVLGLLGPNGSGKTTLVKLLTGLCGADQGTLRWRGGPALPAGQGGPHLREIGVLLEGRGAAYERLSTLENARYFCELRETRFDPGHFRRMAEALGLDDVRAPIRQLSTGNKLRAALIGALIHRPALALLDEPTLGLDLEGVERLQALVRQGTRDGQTFLISSHDLHFIERLCPRIVCIHQGRKRFDGPRETFTHLPHPYRLQVRHPAPCPALPDWLAGRRWERQDEDWALPLKNPSEVMRLAALWSDWLAASEQLQLRRIDLREHYLEYLEQGRESTVATEARP
ncbi:ABC transporter ATP-binding protein [Mitsuaria sp. WAJ17]|uniref:ABC transporter ATP-binding protein n=1 Tax=Mitsuaria sp. WAJ17 TaxID=2761452 RepID=UPI001604173C|nr:ABC transporter ATP-binding protein [Mitsuaria sp. WAJ17]MBB2483863.1 ABC transporter ATP-binding protein [Mitsuaria sp. WAJ17]